MLANKVGLRKVLLGSATAICAAGFWAEGIVAARADQGIETVIVTAEKRAEDIQKVPISMQAVSANAVNKTNTATMFDLQYAFSGLTVDNSGHGAQTMTFIRGDGSTQRNEGQDPSVAYYLDEVYISGKAGLQFDLLDVDRIEVLKGPQTTLFGRNAAAGAISITTKRPSDTFGYDSYTTVGDYGLFTERASVTGPITDDGNLSFRLSGAYQRQNGFTEDLTTGDSIDDTNHYAARGQLEWHPSSSSTILLTADVFEAHDGPPALALQTSTSNCTPQPACLFAISPGEFVVLSAAGIAARNRAGESTYKHYFDDSMDAIPALHFGGGKGFADQNLATTTLRGEWDLGFAQLTSISAYRNGIFRSASDTGTNLNVQETGDGDHNLEVTQELRLADSNGEGSRWHWLAGVYYFYNNINEILTTGFTRYAFASAFGYAQPSNPTNDTIQDNSRFTTDSIALYADVKYNILDNLVVDFGARFTNDNKQMHRVERLYVTATGATDNSLTANAIFGCGGIGQPPSCYNYTTSAHKAWGQFNPSVSLNWTPDENTLIYASYRQGWKSGGFQDYFQAQASAANVPYNPQQSYSYEVGAKANFFDHRLVVDAAVFRNVCTNCQVSVAVVVPAPSLQIQNAGSARTDGIDLGIIAEPVDGLLLDANMTFQNSKYTRYQGTTNVGHHTPFSPNFSGAFTASYQINLGDLGSLTPRAEWDRRSHYFFDPKNTQISSAFFQKGFDLFNAQLSYAPNDTFWNLTFWGKNLTRTKYFVHDFALTAGPLSAAEGIIAPPLTFGVTLNVKS